MKWVDRLLARFAKKKTRQLAEQLYIEEVRGWGKRRERMRGSDPVVRPGDLFLTSSDTWPSLIVRWGTQHEGEPESLVSHVGMITSGGRLSEAQGVEALWAVTEHGIWEARRRTRTEAMAVFRPRTLTAGERGFLVKQVRSGVGRRYAWWQLLLFGIDKTLGRKVFSRMIVSDHRVCSNLIGEAFELLGLTFGVEGRSADPDDIWDFCISHPEKYDMIRALELI